MLRLSSPLNRFLLLILCLLQLNALAQAQTNVMTGTVDFSATVSRQSMSGFLHGLDAWQGIPDSVISPLKPAWFRVAAGDLTLYNRAVSLGSKVEVVISDSYGYPLNNWNGNGAPWENNWQNWENHVRKMAQLYKGKTVYWDVWNEPDSRDWNKTTFWSGSQAQFFETYKRAYTILRQELGAGAMIGGPSYANYEQADLTSFLNYCNSNGLQVNFLSWHELGDADLNIPSIATHISYMKSLAASFPNLKMSKVLINESVGPKTHYYPGDILGYLYYLERGGASGANKACWYAADGSNNCFNGSLDGVIVPKSNAPRAAWWAYRTYAETMVSRVKTSAQNPNLAIFASQNPARVIIGYFGQNLLSKVNVTLYLNNLSALGVTGNSALVTVFRVPASGEAALASPTQISSSRISIVNGVATVTIPGVKLHEEYALKIAP